MNFVAACAVVLMAGAADTPARTTLYVSQLGNNAGGTSWSTAFTTIQAALDAVPDAAGGCRIVVRPDTYMEANLSPKYSGAAGAYNELVGDYDGKLGSGTSGWVIIDNSDPKLGFKSYDWYGTIRSMKQGWSKEHTDPTFSAIIWDRWALRRLYATGGDGALFWDGTDQVKPFTIVVEDCVGIGRAFGGGVGNVLSRAEEPMVFRRCHLWALDWWGDTSGAYVRVENPEMPAKPDVIFEDCTMVGPQCSLKGGNYGFHTFTHVRVDRCRLITLNFSQPQGTPTDGIIQSVQRGKYLHVDIADSTLMGYKVFGVKVEKGTESEIGYTTSGAAQAYVQFQQEVPKGFHRLVQWPVDVFQCLMPPPPEARRAPHAEGQLIIKNMCEAAPVEWKGRLLQLECPRPASGGTAPEYSLVLRDTETGEERARFAQGYGMASVIVERDTAYAFASRFENNDWNDVTMFKSADLSTWTPNKVIVQDPKEHLFNNSVCKDPEGFVMAYESNDPAYPPFTVKFARSKDLESWTKLPDAIFGKDRYTACPCVRYCNGWYYLLYLENRAPRHYFETYVARSKDLLSWEVSPANPVLRPETLDDSVNTSDADIIEYHGKTIMYYSVGDQLTWMNVKKATYDMPMARFFESWFLP